jgi:hypothetical protein
VTQQARLEVYRAQTDNVRALKAACNRVNRQINDCLRSRDDKGLDTNTKLLALLYCGLSEAAFSKLIHTPYGLGLDEIKTIKDQSSQRGVREGWLACASLAIRKITGQKHNHPSNVRKKLTDLIKLYVYEPSLVRNKLAHGQWNHALNRENTALNAELTAEIERLDAVELCRRIDALECLEAIVEDIIESPNRAHRRDYYLRLTEFEEKQKATLIFTLEDKREKLLEKRLRSKRTSRDIKSTI